MSSPPSSRCSSTTVPAALLPDGFRSRHLRRSSPLYRRQCPRGFRLLHRLETRPHRHAARLPERFDKDVPTTRDPRESERRLLLDTYRTFGCEDGQPTYRYSLLDGVKDGFLINPIVVDARTEITTQLLSEDGFVVEFKDDAGDDQQEPTSSPSSRSASSPMTRTSSSARPSSNTPCAIRLAGRSASPSSSPSARITPPSWPDPERDSRQQFPGNTSPTSPFRSPRRSPAPSSSPSTSPTITCSARPTFSPPTRPARRASA